MTVNAQVSSNFMSDNFYVRLLIVLPILTAMTTIGKLLHIYTLKNKGASRCIEEPFCPNGSIKNLYVSQKVLCGERRFF